MVVKALFDFFTFHLIFLILAFAHEKSMQDKNVKAIYFYIKKIKITNPTDFTYISQNTRRIPLNANSFRNISHLHFNKHNETVKTKCFRCTSQQQCDS